MEDRLTCPKCAQQLTQLPNYCPACGEDLRGLTPTSDTLSGPWSGKVIDGRYRLREKLGEGGMGTVYKVEHVRMGKVLALKVLRPELGMDRQLTARFQQEARVVSRLSHPNTIQVFDFGELDDGALYIAMEYLPGRDLAWMLRTHGPFAEDKGLAIGSQVLAALQEAHEKGIIHRDVKPANVMLIRQKDRDDLVKVLDFGIAKLNEGEGRKHITGVADFVGTPAYTSPEQARGEPLDARSDVYSVGALLFELVTGRPLFTGPTLMSVVNQQLESPPPRIADVAPGRAVRPAFEALLRRALEKPREKRFASAEDMRAALEKLRRELGQGAVDFTPLPGDGNADRASRRDFDRFERSLRVRRVAAPLLALGVLVAAGAGAFGVFKASARPVTYDAEREPNAAPAQATPIALNGEVRGTLGAPPSETESDQDVFVVDLAQASAVSLGVTGVADLNVVMEVHHAPSRGDAPRRLALVDAQGLGGAERTQALEVPPGLLFIRLSERAFASEPPRPPRGRPTADYMLSVQARPL